MARSDLSLYESVQSSNLPWEAKSALRRWFDTAVNLPEAVRPSKKQVHGALSSFRQGAESLAAGAVLGLVNVESPGGLEPMGIPLDGIAAGVLLAGAAIGAESDMAPTARNIGSVTAGVFGMRMVTKFCLERRLAKGQDVPAHLKEARIHGETEVSKRVDVNSDPIVRASSAL